MAPPPPAAVVAQVPDLPDLADLARLLVRADPVVAAQVLDPAVLAVLL